MLPRYVPKGHKAYKQGVGGEVAAEETAPKWGAATCQDESQSETRLQYPRLELLSAPRPDASVSSGSENDSQMTCSDENDG